MNVHENYDLEEIARFTAGINVTCIVCHLLTLTVSNSIAQCRKLCSSSLFHHYCMHELYTVFQKKTPTHIIGYKLRSSCLILIIFDIKISHII